ncbi:WXG100 family type VII secretion target [Nocardia sp. X0981]
MSDGGTPVSGDAISVVPEEVRAVGRYIYETAAELRTALDSAARDVEALLGGGWTGVSATKFSNGGTDVRDGGGQIMTALAEMAEKLGVTAESYETTDSNTSSALGTAAPQSSSLRL